MHVNPQNVTHGQNELTKIVISSVLSLPIGGRQKKLYNAIKDTTHVLGDNCTGSTIYTVQSKYT